MKIIYYKKNININENNISAYNLLLKCLVKFNENDPDSFYLTNSDGHPLNYSHLTKKNETYYLKRRLKGSSQMQKAGNTGPMFMTAGIFFGITTTIFYYIYLKVILGKIDPLVKAQMNVFAVENMEKYKQKGGENNDNKNEEKSKLSLFKEKIKKVFKIIGDWLNDNLTDQNINQYMCYTRGVYPYFTRKEDEGSIAATISSTLFFIYMMVILLTMFSNGATRLVCGKPNGGFVVMQLIWMFIPIILAFAIPYIVQYLDQFMLKLKKGPIFSKFKLLTSNVILLIFLIIYMGSNKEGISGAFGGIIFVALILFALFDGIQGVSINKLLSTISAKVSNYMITTTAYSKVPEENMTNLKKASPMDPQYNPIPKNNENKKKLPFKNIRECFPRFELVYNLLKAGILSIIGWMFMAITFQGQMDAACGKMV